MNRLTAAEIGVVLGLTAAGVRSLIRNHQIQAVGKAGRANLYDAPTVVKTLGPHDRRFVHRRRNACGTLTAGDRIP